MSANPPIPKLAYTIKEAVATGLFSRSGLYRAIGEGLIHTAVSCGRTVILATELERYVACLQQRRAA
jgi:hypothetical protein